MSTKRWYLGGGALLVALGYLLFGSSEGSMSTLLGGILWGIGGAFLLIVLVVIGFVTRGKWKGGGDKLSFLGALFDALSSSAMLYWLIPVGVIYLVFPNIITTPNSLWFPLFFWTLFVLFKKAFGARDSSTAIVRRIAFLSTLLVIGYFAVMAPKGSLGTLLGGNSGISDLFAPNIQIPEGIPRDPKFGSKNLVENWKKPVLVASNPQWKRPQANWHGMELGLSAVDFSGKPGREVGDVVNLTTTFTDKQGVRFEQLDFHFSGSCLAVMEPRSEISKVCAGGWSDRGGEITGKFCLIVIEVGVSRYFDIKLFEGNSIPGDCLEKRVFWKVWRKIPHLTIQFRPIGWKEES